MLQSNNFFTVKNLSRLFFINLFFIFLSSESYSSNNLNEVRISYDNKIDKIRIVFDANKKIIYKIRDDNKKKSISLILEGLDLGKSFKKPKIDNKFINKLKLTKDKKNIKFFFSSQKKFQYKYFSLEPKKNYGYRLVLDISIIKDNAIQISKKIKSIKKEKIVIAIDAGHGGRDPGAVGKKGTLEKDIVLSISKKLYKLLKKEKNIKPVLIRNKDQYIPLRHRINKARRYKADLFISIHADAAKNRKAQGSSVYVLSQHGASSEAAKWLANKENSYDLMGGVSIDDKDNDLAQVILDLSQSATIETSIKASSILLSKLGKVSKLHSKNIEQAGFVVLKSPDIPSILVETAFLSNSKEEKKLRTRKFQNNIAKALRDGIIEIIKKGII
jgi:N-acetylmuramoyl-L-alanine amidase